MGSSGSKKGATRKGAGRTAAGGAAAATVPVEVQQKPKPISEPEPEPEPEPLGMETLEIRLVEQILSFLEAKASLVLVCQRFKSIVGKRRQEDLDKNYLAMKELCRRIWEEFSFIEKWSIHRTSPLVMTLRVYDREEIAGMDIKSLGPEVLLEKGRIVSLRRQTQLSNMAEAWRIVGIDSEKTDIFDTTFMHIWESLNMKRWIDRDDILWLDEKDEDVTELVKQMFDTLRNVREKLDTYKELMVDIFLSNYVTYLM